MEESPSKRESERRGENPKAGGGERSCFLPFLDLWGLFPEKGCGLWGVDPMEGSVYNGAPAVK